MCDIRENYIRKVVIKIIKFKNIAFKENLLICWDTEVRAISICLFTFFVIPFTSFRVSVFLTFVNIVYYTTSQT